MTSQVKNLNTYIDLTKLRIMIPVSLTGFTGYFVFDPRLSGNIFIVTAGILLMAMAASVMNQIQEVESDIKMSRTSMRPLPSRSLSRESAIFVFLFCVIPGTAIIFFAGNFKAALIGLLTILWYNGFYTNFKRISAFAVFPGAITGALPPLIGWVSAGGGIFDKHIIFIEFLFFVGQVPHFWLLVLRYGDDYSRAGIPNLTNIFTHRQINRLTFTWIVSSVIAALFLCYFEIIRNASVTGVLLLASLYLIWQFSHLLRDGNGNYRKYSMIFDLYFLLIILLLIADKLIS